VNSHGRSHLQLSTYSERRAKRDRYRRARRLAPDVFQTHTEYVVKAHEAYKEMRDRLLGHPDDETEKAISRSEQTDDPDIVAKELNDAEDRVVRENNAVESIVERRGRSDGNAGDERDERSLELQLVKQLMDLTVRLEAEAREMMLDTMEHGIARTLLLADRNGKLGPSLCSCDLTESANS
jgi:hypothetical protein